MIPTVEQLAAEGYPVRRVNVEQYRDLTQRFRVTSIPCFVMIVNGKEAGRVVGPTSIGRLHQLCSLGRAAPQPQHHAGNAARAAPASSSGMAGNGGPNVPVIPVVYTAVPKAPPVTDAAMLAASVRLRVEDSQGHSCGSGTIIDARTGGEALVLTCGHLFRDSQGTGKIDVDVFGPAGAARVPGRLVAYDLERDVGLVAFRPQGPVTVARVAPPGYPLRAGDAVTSVGCNNGNDPTVQHSRITMLDRFRDPVELRGGTVVGVPHAPWNLQVAGEPVVGRSGGGLFSADGMVIGVCNAKEPEGHEGLFAALGSIHAALDQQELASLYKQAVAPPALVPSRRQPRIRPLPRSIRSLPAARPPRRRRSPARTRRPHRPRPAANGWRGPAAATTAPGTTADGEQAMMEEIRRRVHEGP